MCLFYLSQTKIPLLLYLSVCLFVCSFVCLFLCLFVFSCLTFSLSVADTFLQLWCLGLSGVSILIFLLISVCGMQSTH